MALAKTFAGADSGPGGFTGSQLFKHFADNLAQAIKRIADVEVVKRRREVEPNKPPVVQYSRPEPWCRCTCSLMRSGDSWSGAWRRRVAFMKRGPTMCPDKEDQGGNSCGRGGFGVIEPLIKVTVLKDSKTGGCGLGFEATAALPSIVGSVGTNPRPGEHPASHRRKTAKPSLRTSR